MRIFTKKIQLMFFSIIIPVYNRPDEIEELLESLCRQNYKHPYEIVIIEDGSTKTCELIIKHFVAKLNISYYFKTNSGPGDSRNFGMRVAKGDYFIIFDSDCIIPTQYLTNVFSELGNNFVDCFGGPDAALPTFTAIQKAINFSMTSILTTGGIRGGSEKVSKFQPRSFNMGISKTAFEHSGGFRNIHPGEDPDLSIRLWELGYKTQLFLKAFVYHKRRISWYKFFIQVNKFGKARPILDQWHPHYTKLTFYFPALFISGFVGAIFLSIFKYSFFLYAYVIYFALILMLSSFKNRDLKVGILSVFATIVQFFGYGLGFIKSFILVRIFNRNPEAAFPELFYKPIS